MRARGRHLGHLARRFARSLRPGGPSPDEEAWARARLSPSEQGLWARMSGPDRRHAVAVARRVPPGAVVAALLHDVGKVEAGLGTPGRVLATVAGWVRRDWRGRVGRYLRHDILGAHLLARAGSDPLVVAWAREHHLPPQRWTVDPTLGAALKAADDD